MSLPDPVTRKEMYLSKAATGSGSVPPEPVTREEMYLSAIAEGGGSGGAVPRPSDEAPQMVGDVSSAGNSAQYARADHSHGFDLNTFPAAAEPLVLTLVPGDPNNPLYGTYTGATAEEIRNAFLLGRKIFAKLGNTYITPSLLDADALFSDFIYNSGSTVLYVRSVINVASGANSYRCAVYTGLQDAD